MKIKVWHKKDKVMLYPDFQFSSFNSVRTGDGKQWIYKGGTVWASLTWDGVFMINGEVQDIEILEFTGLQDLRGVDIYEGDIFNIMKDRYVVEYCNLTARYIGRGLFHDSEPINLVGLRRHGFRMGNTYENPELAKL